MLFCVTFTVAGTLELFALISTPCLWLRSTLLPVMLTLSMLVACKKMPTLPLSSIWFEVIVTLDIAPPATNAMPLSPLLLKVT